jgi:nitroreductase
MRAHYAKAVAETRRSSEGLYTGGNLVDMVCHAYLAASSHNAQPWRFKPGLRGG